MKQNNIGTNKLKILLLIFNCILEDKHLHNLVILVLDVLQKQINQIFKIK